MDGEKNSASPKKNYSGNLRCIMEYGCVYFFVEDAESTSEHLRIQQYAIFRLFFEDEKTVPYDMH